MNFMTEVLQMADLVQELQNAAYNNDIDAMYGAVTEIEDLARYLESVLFSTGDVIS